MKRSRTFRRADGWPEAEVRDHEARWYSAGIAFIIDEATVPDAVKDVSVWRHSDASARLMNTGPCDIRCDLVLCDAMPRASSHLIIKIPCILE